MMARATPWTYPPAWNYLHAWTDPYVWTGPTVSTLKKVEHRVCQGPIMLLTC